MQDQEISQKIHKLIEINDMEVKPETPNQDVGLFPSPQYVTIQTPPSPIANSAPGQEGEFVPLDDDTIMVKYNMSYDELRKNIIQARKKNFRYDITSLAFIRERLIVANTRRNLKAISSTKFSFAGVEKSSTQYLMVNKNKL